MAAVGTGKAVLGSSYTRRYRQYTPVDTKTDANDPMSCPWNWARGLLPHRCPVLRSCMRSPACCAPASAMPPATRFATTLPGWTTAKTSCEIFPIALTGFKSVVPRARTLRSHGAGQVKRFVRGSEVKRERDAPEDGKDAGEQQRDAGGPPVDALLAKDERHDDDARQAAEHRAEQHGPHRRLVVGPLARAPRPQVLPESQSMVIFVVTVRLVVRVDRVRICADEQRATGARLLGRALEPWSCGVGSDEGHAEDALGGHDGERGPENPPARAVDRGRDGPGRPTRELGEG